MALTGAVPSPIFYCGHSSLWSKSCTLRNQVRFADPERAQLAVSEPSILSPVVAYLDDRSTGGTLSIADDTSE